MPEIGALIRQGMEREKREALASINGHLAGGTDLPFGARMNLRSIARAALGEEA